MTRTLAILALPVAAVGWALVVLIRWMGGFRVDKGGEHCERP